MENQRDVERIVITGMGAITPLGLTVAETWQKVVQGVSGIGPITLFDATHLPVQIAGEVKGFVPTAYMSFKEVRRRDRYEQLATGAVLEAIKQSGLNPSEEQSRRVGVVISSGIGGLGSLQEAVYTLKDQGMRKVSPFHHPADDGERGGRHDFHRSWFARTELFSGISLRFRHRCPWDGLDDAASRDARCSRRWSIGSDDYRNWHHCI